MSVEEEVLWVHPHYTGRVVATGTPNHIDFHLLRNQSTQVSAQQT